MDKIEERIREVWFDLDDFEEGGFPYVAFIIRNDLSDMNKDNWDEDECIEELCDICINSIRMMMECGYDPEDEILKRLLDHEAKGSENLAEKYRNLYNNNKS